MRHGGGGGVEFTLILCCTLTFDEIWLRFCYLETRNDTMAVIIKRSSRLRVGDSNVRDHQSRLQPNHNIDDGRKSVEESSYWRWRWWWWSSSVKRLDLIPLQMHDRFVISGLIFIINTLCERRGTTLTFDSNSTTLQYDQADQTADKASNRQNE